MWRIVATIGNLRNGTYRAWVVCDIRIVLAAIYVLYIPVLVKVIRWVV